MGIKLIVMLTHNDRTVANAAEIFGECRHVPGVCWGFKDVGIPLDEMKQLAADMKAAGKTVYIESLENDEQAALNSARTIDVCGADYMIGSKYSPKVQEYLKEQGIGYIPDAGECVGRPARLTGTIESITADAGKLAQCGVSGLDLSCYRFDGDAAALLRSVVGCGVPICIAGSINSFERIDEIVAMGADSFTIGGAFFENKFGGTFAEQIQKVADHIA